MAGFNESKQKRKAMASTRRKRNLYAESLLLETRRSEKLKKGLEGTIKATEGVKKSLGKF